LKKVLLFAISGIVGLTACTTSTPPPTPTPTAEITAAATPTSPGSSLQCDPDEAIKTLREVIAYEDTAISHNSISEATNLTVWFVDPLLDPDVGQGGIDEVANIAARDSAELAQWVSRSDPCIRRLFSGMTLIAVDREFNAWYIGGVIPFQLPEVDELDEEGWKEVEATFSDGYRRDLPPAVPNEGSEAVCSWPEVSEELAGLFAPARINVSSHYYIDQDGGAIWVQYDVPPYVNNAEELYNAFLAPLSAIDDAVSCLSPPFTTLWVTYVLPDGSVQIITAVNGDAVRDENHDVMIEQMEVIYTP
jgi:hypothetical protein